MEPPSTFKAECVGRLQFALPDAEVAVVNSKAILQELKGVTRISDGGISMATQFADGQNAGYSQFTYEGQLMVSFPVDETLYKTIGDLFEKQERQLRRLVKPGSVDQRGEPMRHYQIEGLRPGEYAWRFKWNYNYINLVGSTVLKWEAWHDGDEAKEIGTRTFNNIRAARSRPLYTFPYVEQGVCLPYLFVPDDGHARRDIGVTYRLKEHPDVTVWLRDGGAYRSVKASEKEASAHEEIRFFWNLNYSNRKSVVMKENHAFRIAGLAGEYSVVELTRKDGAIDYGYFASAADAPDKIGDFSDLQMFVIRDAQNAKAKGVEPMPKDEFIQLAKAIAATVQKRPVSASAARP